MQNRGAIYLFYTNTTKKKPTLKAIGGLVYLVLAEVFWSFSMAYSNLPYKYRTKKKPQNLF